MSTFKKSSYAPLLLSLSAVAAVLSSTTVHAHGYMTSPPDYAQACSTGQTTSDELCSETASVNKNGINQGNAGNNHQAVVFDNQLCSASKGGEYSVLDVPSSERYTTQITPDENGEVEFSYYVTAAHKTWYMDVFVTRNGFDPDTQTLTWADLERIDTIDYKGELLEQGDQKYKVQWPEDKTGKRIVYNIWQRTNPDQPDHEVLGSPPQDVWDSYEAFYSCMNVYVDGVDPGPGSEWVHEEKFADDKDDLNVGDTVKARIMMEGTEKYTPSVEIDNHNTSASVWKLDLAREINNNPSATEYMKVGVKNSDDEVILSDNAEHNYIYFKEEGLSHLVEVINPEQDDFQFSWNGLEDEYVMSGGQLVLPIDLQIDEGDDGQYTYEALLTEITQKSGAPQMVSGTVGEQPAKAFTLTEAASYSVKVTVTDEYDNREENIFTFVVQNEDVPEPTDTQVTWINNHNQPIISALQSGIWGDWVQPGSQLTVQPDGGIFNIPGWEVEEGESTTFGAAIDNGVTYVNCGALPLSGNIEVIVASDGTCSVSVK
jgi:predicted carbohydrate-binding protein with CBM5 and CBM33 domain